MPRAVAWKCTVALLLVVPGGAPRLDSVDDLPCPAGIVRTPPASASEGPFGDRRVVADRDDHADDVRDAPERRARCDDTRATAPPQAAVRRAPRRPGGRREDEDTAAPTGRDRDRDAQLDDEEILCTDDRCSAPLLPRLEAEPATDRCVAGGIVFRVGHGHDRDRDRDRDHTLEDDALERVERERGRTLHRDVQVRSPADLDALAHIAVIEGALSVDGTSLREISLPELERVDGLWLGDNVHLTRLSLPKLRAVTGWFMLISNPRLARLELPRLDHVQGLSIQHQEALHDLRGLAALHEITTMVQITDNRALVDATLPSLAFLGERFELGGNPALASLSWTMPRWSSTGIVDTAAQTLRQLLQPAASVAGPGATSPAAAEAGARGPRAKPGPRLRTRRREGPSARGRPWRSADE